MHALCKSQYSRLKPNKKHGIAALLVSSLTFCINANAAGISFSQYRIALDDQKRNTSLLVMNDGKLDSRCNIGFSHQQVQSDGSTKPVKAKKDIFNSADSMVRYSPRRVTINSLSSQTVRLSLKRQKNQKKGEYVSYLKLSCRVDNKVSPTEGNLVAAQIHYNIPVVARVGKLSATANMSNAKMNDKNQLLFTMHRTGDRSLYGNTTVTDTSTGKVIGRYNGVAMFLPVEQQQFEVNLTELPKGNLQIDFEETAQFGGDQKASMLFEIK